MAEQLTPYETDQAARWERFYLQKRGGYRPCGEAGPTEPDEILIAGLYGNLPGRVASLLEATADDMDTLATTIAPCAIRRHPFKNPLLVSSKASRTALESPRTIRAIVNGVETDLEIGDHIQAVPVATNPLPSVNALEPSILYITRTGVIGKSLPSYAAPEGPTLPVMPLPEQHNTDTVAALLKWRGYDQDNKAVDPVPVTQLYETLSEAPYELQRLVYTGMLRAKQAVEQRKSI